MGKWVIDSEAYDSFDTLMDYIFAFEIEEDVILAILTKQIAEKGGKLTFTLER